MHQDYNVQLSPTKNFHRKTKSGVDTFRAGKSSERQKSEKQSNKGSKMKSNKKNIVKPALPFLKKAPKELDYGGNI